MVAAALLAPLFLLGGCALPMAASDPTDPEATASTADSMPPADPGPAAPPAPSTSPAPPSTEHPLAGREARIDGFRLALDLYPVIRRERSVALTVRIRVLDRPADPYQRVNQLLSTTGHSVDTTPDGLRLVDARSGVVHLPATADGSPLCAPSFNGGWERGDELWATCIFSTPASDEVTVVVPNFGSFDHVAIR